MVNVYNVTIGQDDCPHTLITAKVKHLVIFVMNTSDEPNGYQNTFSIFVSRDEEDLKTALNLLKAYPDIKGINILGKKENMMSLTYSFPRTSAYKNVKKIGFRLHPIIIKDGIERWFFVSESSHILGDGRTKLDDHVTHVTSIKRLTTNEFITSYSRMFNWIWKLRIDSQTGGSGSEIISEALKAGYYDWPRQSSLSELSKSLNVPRSTLTYKIRKLEKKIFSDIEDSED